MPLTHELRLASISDIHLGHERTPTPSIIANLNREITNRKFLSTIDVLIFAGDVYDRLLNLASVEATLIDQWISSTLWMCSMEDVVVCIDEGTDSHDRKQPIRFVENNEKLRASGLKPVDLRYFTEVAVDTIEKFGLTVLYVPDNKGPTSTHTLELARSLMAEKGLTQVDIAIMHGYFPHQLAEIAQNDSVVHDPAAYLELVRYVIFIGHVHTYSNYERIFAQGSFDRLAHGEEEPKGFLKAVLYPSGDYEVQFIENTGATRYVTVVCDDDDAVEAILKLDQLVQKLPSFSHVRVQATPGHPILTNERVLKERHGQINWSLHSKDANKKRTPVLLDVKQTYTPIVLEPGTIEAVMQERLVQRKYRPELASRVLTALREIKRA